LVHAARGAMAIASRRCCQHREWFITGQRPLLGGR
jgi:hypothetical protein